MGASALLHPVAATQSSTYNNDFPADNCIDGDVEDPKKICHTNLEEQAPWIAIDYTVSVTVLRVEIFNRQDCCGERTKDVEVIVSDQLPTSASNVFSGGVEFDHFRGPATDGEQIVISGDKVPKGEVASGRYVIVQMNNGEGNPLNLQEVKAFGSWPKGNMNSKI